MNREILRLAIPNIISNISVPLLSAVDLALMGHQGGDTTLMIGAIAIGVAVFNMVYWSFGFLRMGTTGMVAQAFGAKNDREISLLLGQGLAVAILIGVLLLAFQIPIARLCFWILGTEVGTESYQLAESYFYIRIWAAPAVLILYVLNGWLFGMQNAKYPLYIVVGVNVANILLNLLFVLGLGMKADGVALGTLIAQYFGLFVACILLFSNYKKYITSLKETFEFKLLAFRRFFTVNADIFIRTVCLIITFTFFTRASTLSGDLVLSTNTILLQLLYISAYAVDGFAFASESLVGKYIGANNLKLLRKSVRLCLVWGVAFASLFGLVYVFFGEEVVGLFAKNDAVIQQAKPYLTWLGLVVLIGAPAFIWDGIYIGATASVAMRNTMLIATFLCFFPVYFILEPSYGNHALWIAMLVYMFSRSVGLWLLAERHVFKQT